MWLIIQRYHSCTTTQFQHEYQVVGELLELIILEYTTLRVIIWFNAILL